MIRRLNTQRTTRSAIEPILGGCGRKRFRQISVRGLSPSMPLWTARLRVAAVAHNRRHRRDEHGDHAHRDRGRRGVEAHDEPGRDDEREARPHQDEVPLLAIHLSIVDRGCCRAGVGVRTARAAVSPRPSSPLWSSPQHDGVASRPDAASERLESVRHRWRLP